MLALTSMNFRCMPTLAFESKRATMRPFSPGAIGSRGTSATVHPQEVFASLIRRATFPELVNSKMCSTTSPSRIFPKEKVVVSNDILASLEASGWPSSSKGMLIMDDGLEGSFFKPEVLPLPSSWVQPATRIERSKG